MAIKELNVDITPQIRKAEVYARRSILSKTLEGNWVTTFKGRGIEFAGYRSYQYGDDASLIDWRASLRCKQTLVREFEEYKNFSVFFLLDVSNSMLFSSNEKLKAEYAAELTYSLADVILRAGDAVGLGMFTDHLITRIYPDIGSGIIEKIAKELTNKKNYGGPFDFKKVIKQTLSFLTGRAIIMIISDFLDMPTGWERYVTMMADHFEVIGIMVRDPRDRELPRGAGQYMLKDPYTNEYLYIDVNQYAEKYKQLVLEEERRIRNVFKQNRGGFVLLTTDKDYTEPLLRFFRRRQFITATV